MLDLGAGGWPGFSKLLAGPRLRDWFYYRGRRSGVDGLRWLLRPGQTLTVIGDAAKPPGSVSKQAYHALGMGECAAANIERLLRGAPLERFRPGPEMGLISLGDIDTYLVIAGVVVASPALAAVKEAVYQLNMARFDPPRDRAALSGIRDRSCNSIIELGLPAVRSLSALARLAELRVLS